MTTPYERVKAAWESADRRGQLNTTVEALAAEGQTQQAIENALEALLLEVRAAGADDDTEEIINGVWDRLTGWCHPKWHIKTVAPAATLAGPGTAAAPEFPAPAATPKNA